MNVVYSRRQAAKLLTVSRDAADALKSLDAHPLLREYFANQLRTQHPNAWQAAHHRLYDYLCQNTTDKPAPTLDELDPLYQAVAHGCLAGRQQHALDDVYYSRITKRDEHYTLNKLGAFGSELGAVSCFFDSLWDRVSPALTRDAQAWLIGQAASMLQAVGRLSEALAPMRASAEFERKTSSNTVVRYNNLSQLECALGDIAAAIADAERCVVYADGGDDSFNVVVSRTLLGHVLHQAGRRNEASTLFQEAEAKQRENEAGNPLLYSVRGSLYCELLLSRAERVAWQLTCHVAPTIPSPDLLAECCAVAERGAQSLKIAERNGWLLDVGFACCTLGQSALCEAVFRSSSLDACSEYLRRAVEGLRRAGSIDDLPRGLLARSWLRSFAGARTGVDSAQEDLDDAWEIAERGPMPLFLADIHLYRARLFGRAKDTPETTPYPQAWGSQQKDLMEARKLIEKHGYGRRKEELEDSEKVLLH
jgi:tetratricopeptide (TPR) repeat protein